MYLVHEDGGGYRSFYFLKLFRNKLTYDISQLNQVDDIPSIQVS